MPRFPATSPTSNFLASFCFAVVSTCALGQTNLDLHEFNSAYLQYTDTKDSEPAVAREAARRAYDLGREYFGVESERTAMLAINYALLLEDAAESQAHLDDAIEIYQAVFGFATEAMIEPLMLLGRTLNQENNHPLAIQYYSRALQLAESHLGEDASKVGAIELELAAINLQMNDLEQSGNRLRRAREILSNYSDAGAQSGLTRIDLLSGEHLVLSGEYEAAIAPLLASLEKFRRFPNAAVTMRNRVALIRAYSNLDDQAAVSEQCLAISNERRLSEEACRDQ